MKGAAIKCVLIKWKHGRRQIFFICRRVQLIFIVKGRIICLNNNFCTKENGTRFAKDNKF